MILNLSFQSTLPLRGATHIDRNCRVTEEISIHAPLTGSDDRKASSIALRRHFNPRSPYGERQKRNIRQLLELGFQSTLPLRGATMYLRYVGALHFISIHAPLTGSDRPQM